MPQEHETSGENRSLGSVYTRPWVVSLVLDVAGYTSDAPIDEHLVIEPACGDGAFLTEIARRLVARGVVRQSDLKGRVYALDTDAEAVIRARTRVAAALVRCGVDDAEAVAVARHWIHVGDFLDADLPEARWVIANPPYVRPKDMPRSDLDRYVSRVSTMTLGTDLYVGFIQRGLEALDAQGILCYICPDRWLQNRYGRRLRTFVGNGYHLATVLRMHDVDAFEDDVAAYPAVTRVDKGTGPTLYGECHDGFGSEDAAGVLAWLRDGGHVRGEHLVGGPIETKLDDTPMPLGDPASVRGVLQLSRKFPTLEEAGVRVGIGIASGLDSVYVTDDPTIVEPERLLPLFFMRDWRAGRKRRLWLVNPWDEDGRLVDLDAWPRFARYMHEHEAEERARSIARSHPDTWWRTLDRPDMSLMGRPALFMPDMTRSSAPVLSDGSLYPHHNTYWAVSDTWDLEVPGGLLMSDVAESFVDLYGVHMRGHTLRFEAQYLRLMHVPHYDGIDGKTKKALAGAFKAGDRAAASRAARIAYGLSEGECS